MEDKTFELLTKMYSEFSQRFDRMENDISGLKEDVSGLKKDIICLENKLDNHTEALYDGYKQTYEKVNDHEVRIQVLEKCS